MNDANLTELKVVVERTVQPIRATMARKRRMREELLAHLVAILAGQRQVWVMNSKMAAFLAVRI